MDEQAVGKECKCRFVHIDKHSSPKCTNIVTSKWSDGYCNDCVNAIHTHAKEENND